MYKISNTFLPLFVILLTTYSQLILRLRLHNKPISLSLQNININSLLGTFTDFWILSSIGSFLLSFICWSLVLSSNLNATKMYPIVASLTIFLVSLLNFIIFRDKINPSNIVGGVFIILGVCLLLKHE